MPSTRFEYESNSFGVDKNSSDFGKVTDWMLYSHEWFGRKSSMNNFFSVKQNQHKRVQFNKNRRYLCLLILFNQQLDDSILLTKEQF